jgi:hypothetical protein
MTKGGISIRTIIVLVILVLVGVLGVLAMNTVKTYMSGAASDIEPENILAKSAEDGKSAVITWTTKKDSQAVVEYGTTPASLLLRSIESQMTTSHSVTLTPLRPGVTYYYRFKFDEDAFDNGGIPFSFKTLGDGLALEGGTPTMTPRLLATPKPVLTGAGTQGGPCSQKIDRNKDGIINGFDVTYCFEQMRSGTGGTSSVVPTSTDVCLRSSSDTNKDGRVSGAEVAACRQISR